MMVLMAEESFFFPLFFKSISLICLFNFEWQRLLSAWGCVVFEIPASTRRLTWLSKLSDFQKTWMAERDPCFRTENMSCLYACCHAETVFIKKKRKRQSPVK